MPLNRSKAASRHQKHPPPSVAMALVGESGEGVFWAFMGEWVKVVRSNRERNAMWRRQWGLGCFWRAAVFKQSMEN